MDVVEVDRLMSSVNQSISEVVALESETQQLGINELILPQVVSVNELAIRDGYVDRMSVGQLEGDQVTMNGLAVTTELNVMRESKMEAMEIPTWTISAPMDRVKANEVSVNSLTVSRNVVVSDGVVMRRVC